MGSQSLEYLFDQLRLWKSGSERAPHKPLLILYALGRCFRGAPRLVPYADVDSRLRTLLAEFGPPRTNYHPEYPFWRLKNDGVWVLENDDLVVDTSKSGDPKRSELVRYNVLGGFPEPMFDALRSDANLLVTLAHRLLDAHFATTLHNDILEAVGIDLASEVPVRQVRDPQFRNRVLNAYGHRCAICAFDVRLGSTLLALDAAHIKWHQAGGPDVENNGLALCVMHHKLFDRGAFTIYHNASIAISNHLNGSRSFDDHLLRFHGAKLRLPPNPSHRPAEEFLSWHHSEVFRGPARYLAGTEKE